MKKPTSPEGKTNKQKTKYSIKTKNRFSSKRIEQVVPKYIITLRILLQRSLIELEALSIYGETCLHSTISTLSNQKGIRFYRKSEAHKHRNGGVTHFTRYSIFDEDKEKAKALIKPFEASNDG